MFLASIVPPVTEISKLQVQYAQSEVKPGLISTKVCYLHFFLNVKIP